MKTYVTRGRAPFKALSCTTFIIATNHMDALPVPADDRRLAVIRNGASREPAYWERLIAWMDDPANIAAFHRWLMAIDLTGYSPFAAPPAFEGKQAMVAEGKSDLDHAFEEVVEAMPSSVMTVSQIVDRLRDAKAESDYDFPDRWKEIVKRMAANQLYRVGVRDSINWQIKVGTRKFGVYARSPQAAAKWKTAEGLREETLKNGPLAHEVKSPGSFR